MVALGLHRLAQLCFGYGAPLLGTELRLQFRARTGKAHGFGPPQSPASVAVPAVQVGAQHSVECRKFAAEPVFAGRPRQSSGDGREDISAVRF
jgi:hypothetical protein